MDEGVLVLWLVTGNRFLLERFTAAVTVVFTDELDIEPFTELLLLFFLGELF